MQIAQLTREKVFLGPRGHSAGRVFIAEPEGGKAAGYPAKRRDDAAIGRGGEIYVDHRPRVVGNPEDLGESDIERGQHRSGIGRRGRESISARELGIMFKNSALDHALFPAEPVIESARRDFRATAKLLYGEAGRPGLDDQCQGFRNDPGAALVNLRAGIGLARRLFRDCNRVARSHAGAA